MPPLLEYRRGRWHYHYVIKVTHLGVSRRREIRCLSSFPDESAESPRNSQADVYLHRERARLKITAEIEAEIEMLERQGKPTFAELADSFLDYAAEHELEMNVIQYMLPILTASLPTGPAEDITTEQARSSLNHIRQERELSPRTSDHYRSIAHGIFQLAVSDGRLTSNPISAIKPKKLPRKKPQRFSLLQVHAILAALERFEAELCGRRRNAMKRCQVCASCAFCLRQREHPHNAHTWHPFAFGGGRCSLRSSALPRRFSASLPPNTANGKPRTVPGDTFCPGRHITYPKHAWSDAGAARLQYR